ncbi:MAG: hypothetical protein GX072_14670 [Lysinibacillus sp.]|nr:hypothetical protein [Lysinibacillus sp.]
MVTYHPFIYGLQEIYSYVLYFLGLFIIIATIACVIYGFFHALFYSV